MERNAFQGKVDIHIIVERAHKSFLLSNPLVNDKAADGNQTKESVTSLGFTVQLL